jgi:hypothetical protein
MEPSALQANRKAILVVLFVPSVERDGATPIDQPYWVEAALDTFGQLFGGATAFPRARGVWRDDERAAYWLRTNPSSFTATRHPQMSLTRPASVVWEISAGGWAARPTKARSG